MKLALTAALAVIAVSGLVASSASATVVNAKFSSPALKLTTTGITIKKNGTEAKICTPKATIEATAEGSGYFATNQWDGTTGYWCPSGTELESVFYGEAKFDNVANRYYLTLTSNTTHSLMSPYGSWWQETRGLSSSTWTNGSGTTPSTLTFANQTLGYTLSNARISIDGTFTVKSSTGGLVTLSH